MSSIFEQYAAQENEINTCYDPRSISLTLISKQEYGEKGVESCHCSCGEKPQRRCKAEDKFIYSGRTLVRLRSNHGTFSKALICHSTTNNTPSGERY